MSDLNIKLLTNRALPAPEGDGIYRSAHCSRYGEPIVASLMGDSVYPLADEGSYFIATNPTMGTGIAGIAASTSFDATEHLLHLRNVSTSKRCYLHYIDLVVTAAGANGTTTGFTMTADRGVSRFSTGGSDITPKSPNLALSETADVTLKFGALVTTAASLDVRNFGDFLVRPVIKVVGDSYRFVFGHGAMPWSICGAALEGTAPVKVTIPCAPVVLGENDQFLLSDWGASQSGASSYQFRMGFWMR